LFIPLYNSVIIEHSDNTGSLTAISFTRDHTLILLDQTVDVQRV
jgi:hypothetical protein